MHSPLCSSAWYVDVVVFIVRDVQYSIPVQVSDAIRGDDNSDHAESLSLQKALYITCFAAAIGSAFALATTFYIDNDEHQMRQYVERHDNQQQDSNEKEPLLNSKSSSINAHYSVNNDAIDIL